MECRPGGASSPAATIPAGINRRGAERFPQARGRQRRAGVACCRVVTSETLVKPAPVTAPIACITRP